MPRRFERHRRGDEWSSQPARSDETRQAAGSDPEPVRRPPGRKNTRRWCRGIKGREHQLAVVLRPWRDRVCRWRETGAYVRSGDEPVPPRGVTLPKRPWYWRRWVVTGRRWECWHEWQCQVCGKYLGKAEKCPDYPAE
jgi:hypothetical protein